MTGIVFEIFDPRGRRESVSVEGRRASIGSASHCDVRLPMEDAGAEHVRVMLAGDELAFEALLATPPVVLDGAPLGVGTLATGSELRVGRMRLCARRMPGEREALASAGGGARRPLLVPGLGLLLALGVCAFAAARQRPESSEPELDAELALFSELAPSCPQRDPERALALARQHADLGETQRERLPFLVQEGMSAVDSYELAAACFRAGGAAALAEQTSAEAELLKRSLQDDFRARRLRLSRMLDVGDDELARADVAWLRALLRGKSGPYVRWLESVAQELGGGQP